MELYMNDQKLDITLENEKTVGDVLYSFEKKCEEEGLATIAIKLNGKNINGNEFDGIRSVPLAEDTKIELSVVNSKDVDAAFKELATNFEGLSHELEEVPALLQSGGGEAQEIIGRLTDQISFFVHTATLSALFPQKYGKIDINGTSLNDFFAEFSSILKDLEQAMLNNDMVSVGDLTAYEISPRLGAMASALKGL